MHTMTKAATAVIKAVGPTDPNEKAGADGLGPGQFKALVSVFGNVDSYGDVVMPGAFADVLAEKSAAGQPIPVVWAHQWADVFAHIGHVEPGKAVETAEGLEVIGTLDVDSPVAAAAERAQQVHRLLATGRVSQFSFAFDVGEAGWGERGDGDSKSEVFELRKFSALHEVGPCLVGVNSATRLETVKAIHDAYPRKSADADDPNDTPADKAGAAEDQQTDSGDAPGEDAGTPPGLDPASAALLADIAGL